MNVIVTTAFAKQVGQKWGVASPLAKTEFYDTLPKYCPITDMQVLVNPELYDLIESVTAEAKTIGIQIMNEYIAVRNKYLDQLAATDETKAFLAFRKAIALSDLAAGLHATDNVKEWTIGPKTLWEIAMYEMLNEKMGGPTEVLEACSK